MLVPRVPYPPDHGAALRNWQILRWLGARHEVTLLGFGDPARASALAAHARRVEVVAPPRRSLLHRLRCFATSKEPDLVRRLWSPELAGRLSSLVRTTTFDLVQIEGLEMHRFWKGLGEVTDRATVVLDEHNAEYALQESAWQASLRQLSLAGAAYSLIQAHRLRAYERQAGEAAQGVVVVSREDELALRALSPRLRLTVIPNGVDPTFYAPEASSADGTTVLFIGKLDYRPNVDAVEWLVAEIWPRVRRAEPRARLWIVGRDPLPRVRRLGQAPGVEVVGGVSDERPWFRQSTVLVVPMRMGGGVRLKVLQALAMGTPVVSTPAGIAGVDARDGEHYLLGRSAPELADCLLRALADRRLRCRLAEAGRALVGERYDWRVILPRFDELYREITREA